MLCCIKCQLKIKTWMYRHTGIWMLGLFNLNTMSICDVLVWFSIEWSVKCSTRSRFIMVEYLAVSGNQWFRPHHHIEGRPIHLHLLGGQQCHLQDLSNKRVLLTVQHFHSLDVESKMLFTICRFLPPKAGLRLPEFYLNENSLLMWPVAATCRSSTGPLSC